MNIWPVLFWFYSLRLSQVGAVSSPTHTFSLGKLTNTSCTYLRLWLTTALKLLISRREEYSLRNYFMIILHEVWDLRDRIRDPNIWPVYIFAILLLFIRRSVSYCMRGLLWVFVLWCSSYPLYTNRLSLLI